MRVQVDIVTITPNTFVKIRKTVPSLDSPSVAIENVVVLFKDRIITINIYKRRAINMCSIRPNVIARYLANAYTVIVPCFFNPSVAIENMMCTIIRVIDVMSITPNIRSTRRI